MDIEFPIIIKHKNITLKLFDWMDYPKNKAARNVEAYDSNGNQIWVIESLGGISQSDCYTNISSRNGNIHAFNFQCYDCIIDENNGKVISTSFTK